MLALALELLTEYSVFLIQPGGEGVLEGLCLSIVVGSTTLTALHHGPRASAKEESRCTLCDER